MSRKNSYEDAVATGMAAASPSVPEAPAPVPQAAASPAPVPAPGPAAPLADGGGEGDEGDDFNPLAELLSRRAEQERSEGLKKRGRRRMSGHKLAALGVNIPNFTPAAPGPSQAISDVIKGILHPPQPTHTMSLRPRRG